MSNTAFTSAIKTTRSEMYLVCAGVMWCDDTVMPGTFVFFNGEHWQGINGLVWGEGGAQRTAEDVLEKWKREWICEWAVSMHKLDSVWELNCVIQQNVLRILDTSLVQHVKIKIMIFFVFNIPF